MAHRFPSRSVRAMAGASFKPQHLDAILNDAQPGVFFEVHAENYMGAGGPAHAALTRICERHPVSLHGVAMSLGGPDALDPDHLARFAALVQRYEPALVSEHLAWSSHADVHYNDLLPLPYTDDTLSHVCAHVSQMQDAIARPILLENPSTYLLFRHSSWSETDFLREISRRTGCGLLLDLNNVFISAINHGTSADAYLAAFPLDRVGEIHLAGHDTQADDAGLPLLIDTHDRAVPDPVWSLYRRVIGQIGPVPTLVEWDADLPDWPVLKAEAHAAAHIMHSLSAMGRRHVA
ncbi:MAG: DUF692 domain-containing protein [Rhizobiaceae bacterium]|jgi:hypothetical protein|nr:DUF692 domain-containing protein [Rhizobiaceae bacterium]